MAQDFNEILSSMLKDLDNGKSVEEIIAAKMAEMGLSEESQANVNEAVDYVDKIDSASESLRDAIAHGASRQEWLDDKIEKQIEKLPEELQDKAVIVLDKATKQYFDNLDK